MHHTEKQQTKNTCNYDVDTRKSDQWT